MLPLFPGGHPFLTPHSAVTGVAVPTSHTQTHISLQLVSVYTTGVKISSDWWQQYWLMFRKNKYPARVPSTAQLYRATSVYKEALFWPALSTPQPRQGLYTAQLSLRRGGTFPLQHSDKCTASSCLAHFCCQLRVPSNNVILYHQLSLKSVVVLLHHGKGDWVLSTSVFQVSCGLLPQWLKGFSLQRASS